MLDCKFLDSIADQCMHTPLIELMRADDLEGAKAYIKDKSNDSHLHVIDLYTGMTLVHWAVLYDKPEFIKLLAHHEVSLTSDLSWSPTPLQFAEQNQRAQCIKLLKELLNPNTQKQALIFSNPTAKAPPNKTKPGQQDKPSRPLGP